MADFFLGILVAFDLIGIALLILFHIPDVAIWVKVRQHQRRSAALRAFRASQRDADARRYVDDGSLR